MIIKQGTTLTTSYVETDHQGSITGLLNTNGTYAEKYSYDACFVRRSFAKAEGQHLYPTDWSFNNVTLPTLFDRGYTGHAGPPKLKRRREHPDKFDLINMLSGAKSRQHSVAGNGRMYDPYLGRFLSVDPVIQSTANSQTSNGYSYCLNNPLKFTDPTGYSYGNDAWTNPYSEHSVTEMMNGLFGLMAGDLSMSLADQNSFWNYYETMANSGANGGKGESNKNNKSTGGMPGVPGYIDNADEVGSIAAGMIQGGGELTKADALIRTKQLCMVTAAQREAYMVGKVVTNTGRLVAKSSNVLKGAVAVYNVASGNDNTSTWVDIGASGLLYGAGVLAAGTVGLPVVAVAGVGYAIWSLAGGSDWIDRNWGYRPVKQ